jgi:hypothetical protein
MKSSSSGDSAERSPSPSSALHDRIRRRAEQIYVRNGKVPGRDAENWAQAEREIQQESHLSAPKRAIIIRVDGVQYVGEYDRESCDYSPGEFGRGVSVPVRFEGDRMFIKRPNGQELETRIVKKIG